MDPLQVSAQFVAWAWFSDGKPDTPDTHEAARRFARDNWLSFLPYAHAGWGRFLIRVAELPPATVRRQRRRRPATANRTPRRPLAVAV